MIKIDSSDLNKFSVMLRELPDEIKNDVRKVVKNSAFNIERNAKSSASVKTGHLRRSISTKMGDMEATIHTSNLKYAPMVEFGTRPHIIRAKNKKALYWKGATHPVKQVNHPGSKAKPYLIPAFEKEIPYFVEKLKEVVEW